MILSMFTIGSLDRLSTKVREEIVFCILFSVCLSTLDTSSTNLVCLVVSFIYRYIYILIHQSKK